MNPFGVFPSFAIPRPQTIFFVTLPNGNVLPVPPEFGPRPFRACDFEAVLEPPRRQAETNLPAARPARPAPEAAPRYLRDEEGNLFERKGDRLRRIEPAPAEDAEEAEPRASAPPQPILRPLGDGAPLRRLLRFGEWRGLLAGAVRQPERLTDAHQLPCELSLFELNENTDPEALRRAAPGPLAPLDRAAAERLGIPRLAPAVEPRPAGVPRHWKGERFFTARIVHDPTAEPAQRPPQPRKAGPPPAKDRIPRTFVKPWEFTVSREAALEAMRGAGKHPNWRERLARFLLRADYTAAVEGWRRTLAGRPLEEQLWAVRPPAGATADPEIRRWAAETLAAARYDVPKMLFEWEVFWRRKGI